MDQHIATLRATADDVHASDDALKKEAASLQAILRYTPQSESEVNEKLTYIAAYILKTGKVLTPQEMNLVLVTPGGA